MKNFAQNTDALLYGCILMLFVFVGRIQELFTFLLPFRLGLLSLALSVVIFIIFTPRQDCRFPYIELPQVKIILAIFSIMLISVPFSVWVGQSFNTVKYMVYTLVFFYLSLYAVNSFDGLRKFVYFFIISSFFLAFFAVTAGGSGRASASYTYDPNDIAMLLVVTLPFVYFFIRRVNFLSKLFLICSLFTILMAIILTGSRGGFIALVVSMLLIFFNDSHYKIFKKIIFVGVIALVFGYLAPQTYWDRMATIVSYEEGYNMQSESGRKTIWLRGLGLMMENPVTGVGAGAFTTALGYSYGREGFKWSTAHNAFVQIGAELGIGGFVLFVFLILYSIVSMRRIRKKYQQLQCEFKDNLWITNALEISLCGYCVSAMFLSAAYSPMFYLLISLCCMVQKLDILEKRCKQDGKNVNSLRAAGVNA